MRETEVVTRWLEMNAPEELRPATGRLDRLRLAAVDRPAPELAWFLYAAVGRRWRWTDRLGWSLAEWADHLAREDVRLHLARRGEAPAGYVEYRLGLPEEVQIWYFGLLPSYMGRGLGGELLTHAVRTAWGWNPGRVWLHTCSLDAPAALANYRARGFRVYDEKRETKLVPETVRPVFPPDEPDAGGGGTRPPDGPPAA